MGSISEEKWLDYATIDPELDAILSKLPETPKISGDIHELRKILAERKAAMTAAQSGNTRPEGIVEKDFTIKCRDGYSMPARSYSPTSPPADGSPVIMILHGGGFCLGGLENEELNCRNFCAKLGCVAVNIDYRLAPEHPFPVPSNDSWDALKWVAGNMETLKGNPEKGFIVGGTSAGGNLSAVVGLMARDEGLKPALTGLFLCIPALLGDEVVPEKWRPLYRSFEQNKDAPILPQSAMELFMGHYKPEASSWHANPFNHPKGHGGLPPVYFQICGMDPLRDEALIYEKVLREEYGIKTLVDVYPGQPHGFWSWFPDMKASSKLVADATKGVKWLLDNK